MRRQVKAPSTGSIEHRGIRGALLAVLATAMLCGLFAASAQAATVYRFDGPRFGEYRSGEGELTTPQGVVVDDQTGYALVADRRNRISIYETSAGATKYLEAFGEAKFNKEGEEVSPQQFSEATALAIDQAERVLYVVDQGVILKYDISGSGPLEFTRDLSFTSPTVSPFGDVRIAVDPTDGDLLLAETSGGVVNRYESDGTFVSSFNGAGSPGGTFSQISGLAVDPAGSVYVVDIKSGLALENPRSLLERFASDGTPDLSFAPDIQTPEAVTVDQGSDNVIVVGRADGAGPAHPNDPPFPIRLYTLHGDQIIDELDFPADTQGATVPGLGVGGIANGHLYATTLSGLFGNVPTAVYALRPFKVPDLQLSVGAVTSFTVQLTGSANPLEQESTYHYEYSREGGPVQSTETLPLGEGSTPVPLSTELTELIANSEYEVRLVATVVSTGVTVSSPAQHFTTPPAAPRVITGDAIDRMNTSVTLLGRINPYGEQTHYRFEYGTTDAYGQQQPVDHDDVAGGGRDSEWAKAYLTNLEPGTEYHYRLVAESAKGRSVGVDRTFITLGPPDRYYEQVTPVEKGGSEANGFRGFYATPDGEGLMYQWKTAPQNGPAGPAQPHGFAWRGADGWSALSLEPVQAAGTPVFANTALSFTLDISEDGTKALAVSLKGLAPGATDGNTNLYLIDTHTGAYTTMASFPGTEVFNGIIGLGVDPVVSGTPNFSQVLLRPSYNELIEGAPFGALYEWNEGQLSVASIAPDGTPLGSVEYTPAENNHPDPHPISTDGSKVFFTTQEGGQTAYVRIDRQETVRIGGRFIAASTDGHYAFVTGVELTPDSEPEKVSLYRFNTETRNLILLTAVGTVGETEAILQVADNGSSVFFNSPYSLAPGAPPVNQGRSNLYVWHDSEVRLIGTETNGAFPANPGSGFMASPNGRYFAFGSYAPLTGFDNSSKFACVEFNNGDPGSPQAGGVACPEVFRYDVDTGKLQCASCPRDGARTNGRARIVAAREGSYPLNRAMLDNGMVVFDTTQELSSRDVNSTKDVYTFDGSEQVLISAGVDGASSQFDDASADGRDIFFTTQDRLVGQDTDSLADIYDARIGGGIAGQNPPPPRPECIRDDCKATPNQGPELPFGGSEALNGPENVHESNARKGCAKGSYARKVKGKTRCVKQAKKKQTKKHRKQAKSNRRQGR